MHVQDRLCGIAHVSRVKALQIATKRKHVTLTLSEKLKIIDLRGSGCSLARISAEYGIE